MMRAIFLLISFVLLSESAKTSRHISESGNTKLLNDLRLRIDINSDGIMDDTELAAFFAQNPTADVNENGRLDRQEFFAAAGVEMLPEQSSSRLLQAQVADLPREPSCNNPSLGVRCGKGMFDEMLNRICWCDSECHYFGDCCPDKCTVCPNLSADRCRNPCSSDAALGLGCFPRANCTIAGVGAVQCRERELQPWELTGYSWQLPLTTCSPNCAGRACGPNGCGGTCGTCSSPSMCANGRCACPPGSDTCGKSNACEVNTNTNTAHCGGCGRACTIGELCQGGACVVASCSAGTANCEANVPGCETSILTNSAHCGACGVACGSGYMCVGGKCTPTVCKDSMRDCYEGPVKCETDSSNNRDHCGQCGLMCKAYESCKRGVCVLDPSLVSGPVVRISLDTRTSLVAVVDTWFAGRVAVEERAGDSVGETLRLAFHDSVTWNGTAGGASGCLFHRCAASERCQYSERDNNGLISVVDSLWNLYQTASVGNTPVRKLASLPDFVYLAIYRVVEISSKQNGFVNGFALVKRFKWGRAMCPVEVSSFPGSIPAVTVDHHQMVDLFQGRLGLTVRQWYALMGAHACGRAQRSHVGLARAWTDTPALLSNTYYKMLADLTIKWTPEAAVLSSTNEDVPSSAFQYEIVGQPAHTSLMMLSVDIELAWFTNSNDTTRVAAPFGGHGCVLDHFLNPPSQGSAGSCPTRLVGFNLISEYANSLSAWSSEFLNAMQKITENTVSILFPVTA